MVDVWFECHVEGTLRIPNADRTSSEIPMKSVRLLFGNGRMPVRTPPVKSHHPPGRPKNPENRSERPHPNPRRGAGAFTLRRIRGIGHPGHDRSRKPRRAIRVDRATPSHLMILIEAHPAGETTPLNLHLSGDHPSRHPDPKQVGRASISSRASGGGTWRDPSSGTIRSSAGARREARSSATTRASLPPG